MTPGSLPFDERFRFQVRKKKKNPKERASQCPCLIFSEVTLFPVISGNWILPQELRLILSIFLNSVFSEFHKTIRYLESFDRWE